MPVTTERHMSQSEIRAVRAAERRVAEDNAFKCKSCAGPMIVAGGRTWVLHEITCLFRYRSGRVVSGRSTANTGTVTVR
jgi:hypothetical protein